ncbi:DDE-type integrase/transposase/recombinase [Octopus vulgaris]|uniref:DDE-type integrase/transposase/recombinase n=1 Tax=Octopus vulgaris TaxID=6645 RepID=A0AA36BGG9_OCTVU|nr:DDE-type integrase/transposase/recombinase [Octopus vulgaris]
MRTWRPHDVSVSDHWQVREKIVVLKEYRLDIMNLVHNIPLAGKTKYRILQHFYWPSLFSDVASYCRSCKTCQLVGKPNATIGKAPLKPIAAVKELFSRIIIDVVGPLPRTKSGYRYLFAVLDQATGYPEAIPLKEVSATTVSDALVKLFTQFGFPEEIQSDRGSNFMSSVFQIFMYKLAIKQLPSTAYQPQAQGALERYPQVLKNMLRTYCLEHEED